MPQTSDSNNLTRVGIFCENSWKSLLQLKHLTPSLVSRIIESVASEQMDFISSLIILATSFRILSEVEVADTTEDESAV